VLVVLQQSATTRCALVYLRATSRRRLPGPVACGFMSLWIAT